MPSSHPRRTRALAAFATAATAFSLALVPVTAASAAIVEEPVEHSAADAALTLNPAGSFETGVFDESAAEIVKHYGERVFVVNAQAGSVDVLDASDPAAMTAQFSISSAGVANSVAIRDDGLGVIAFESEVKTDPGHLLFFDANAADASSAVLGEVTVGALPDMVTITDDGAYAVVANEGEPAENFSIDPEGSVGVVELPGDVSAPAQDAVRTAGFGAFEGDALPEGVRVFGPAPHGDDLPVSRNLEPEYIATSGTTAYAALQEANAIAVVDLESATVTDLLPLGDKDHGTVGLDPSDRDPEDAPTIDIRTYDGLHGLYMPDAMEAFEAGGETYLVTANEGDAREWGDYVESVRVKDLAEEGYGPMCADSPLAGATGDADLGRLKVTIEEGFDEAAGCYSELYAFGARSFSVWNTAGEQVFDSGSEFEEITAAAAPEFFNSNHSESNLEGRSDDKGPEPEALTIGEVDGRTYAFIGFERVGGIAVYDITDPAASTFVTYHNNRDFSVSVEDAADPEAVLSDAGDLGPESIDFIPAEESATGSAMIAVGNEVSGTTTLFDVESAADDGATELQILTINDFHGRIEANFQNDEAGAAVLAGAVNSYRENNPNTLFASAGDNIGASTFTSFIDQDNPTIDSLVEMGLDVSAVGNHEFDQGFADLTDRVIPRYGSEDLALGANVYHAGTTDPALPEYAIRTVDGVDVAFIGTVTADTATLVNPDGIADIEFGDELEAANRVADRLAQQDLADVTVLLTHSGSGNDQCEAIAEEQSTYGKLVHEASPEIDAIVSGHTHQLYDCEIAGPDGTERPVMSSHQYGTTLGALDVSVDAESGELISIQGTSVPLVVDEEPQFPADPDVQRIVDEAVAFAEEEGSVEVGRISDDILRGGNPPGDDRSVESTLGNLVADIYAWAASEEYDKYGGSEEAQIGLMNPGGLRDDLRHTGDGTVTYRDVANVQPFANTLVTMSLTGEQLEQVLEEQWQPDGEEQVKLHLGISDGFSYEYVADAPLGEHIVSMSYRGEQIQPDDELRIVTNSFIAAGGDDFTTLTEGSGTADSGLVDLSASVDYFAAHDVVDPAPLGRAVESDGSEPGPSPEPEDPEQPGPEDPEQPGPDDPEQPNADWVSIVLSSTEVQRGQSLGVTLRDLNPGQQVSATLHSEPLTVENIPAADENGTVSFSVAIPADFATGAHRLEIASEGYEPVFADVTVTAAPGEELAVTGSQAPWGLALAGAFLLAAGLTFTALRRRSTPRP